MLRIDLGEEGQQPLLSAADTQEATVECVVPSPREAQFCKRLVIGYAVSKPLGFCNGAVEIEDDGSDRDRGSVRAQAIA
jgi:hypothetical protein